MFLNTYIIELRANNIFLVKIPSKPYRGQLLPDTVFTFRPGDPQYELWKKRYHEQHEQENSHFDFNKNTQDR